MQIDRTPMPRQILAFITKHAVVAVPHILLDYIYQLIPSNLWCSGARLHCLFYLYDAQFEFGLTNFRQYLYFHHESLAIVLR